jgi:hypothetical protein
MKDTFLDLSFEKVMQKYIGTSVQYNAMPIVYIYIYI